MTSVSEESQQSPVQSRVHQSLKHTVLSEVTGAVMASHMSHQQMVVVIHLHLIHANWLLFCIFFLNV